MRPLLVPCDPVHVARNLRADQTASQVGHDRLWVALERVAVAPAPADALDPDLALGDRSSGTRRVCDFVLAGERPVGDHVRGVVGEPWCAVCEPLAQCPYAALGLDDGQRSAAAAVAAEEAAGD